MSFQRQMIKVSVVLCLLNSFAGTVCRGPSLHDKITHESFSKTLLQCYNVEVSNTCIKINNSIDKQWFLLSQEKLEILNSNGDYQEQKRSQLGFYSPWIQAIEMMLRFHKINNQYCKEYLGIRTCKIKLENSQSMLIYQSSNFPKRWITHIETADYNEKVLWWIEDELFNPSLSCTLLKHNI